MGRDLRYLPPGMLVEVTTRTVQGRYLLRPSRELNDLVAGVLARTARRTSVGVCIATVLSNHWQALLLPEDAEALARFMAYANGNIAREANRLYGWSGPLRREPRSARGATGSLEPLGNPDRDVRIPCGLRQGWSRRYRAIVISDDPVDQVARFRYVLRQGTKERLVWRPKDWPGVHCAEALVTGKPLRGFWFDRTARYQARRRGETVSRYDHSYEETLHLEPLPCWKDVSPEDRRARAAELTHEIEREARAKHREAGTTPMGVKQILRQHPHSAPAKVAKSPAPRFHVSCYDTWRCLQVGYWEFLAACLFRRKRSVVPIETGQGSERSDAAVSATSSSQSAAFRPGCPSCAVARRSLGPDRQSSGPKSLAVAPNPAERGRAASSGSPSSAHPAIELASTPLGTALSTEFRP